MSTVSALLDEALSVAGKADFQLIRSVVQRRISRRVLVEAARQYRRVADLCDRAAQILASGNRND